MKRVIQVFMIVAGAAWLGACAGTEGTSDDDLADAAGGPDEVDADPTDAGTDAEETFVPDGAPDADDTDATPVDAARPDGCVADPDGETCNGQDDDCDALVDEGFMIGTSCTAGLGACQATGQRVCAAGGATSVCNAVTGTGGAETCNGLDDDCDGVADDGNPGGGSSCTTGMPGVCSAGTMQCQGAAGLACVAGSSGGAESCNGLDDDCDGPVDEGFGLQASCDGADGDLCHEGFVVCNGVGGTTCSDTSGTNGESCDGLDNDCDTLIDEGYGLGAACDGGDGDVCSEGQLVCNPAGTGTQCDDATGTTVETCDGTDEDCDTSIDEGFDVGASCNAGVGACYRSGSKVCAPGGATTQCSVSAGLPAAEYCGDAVDSDCSGGADPTCPANDLPAGAINISGGGSFTANVTYAHDDAAGGCSLSGGRDVFYQLTLAAAQVVYFDTFGSDFDTVLRLHAGACAQLGAETTCKDDHGCGGTFPQLRNTQLATSLAAGTYCLVVDQHSTLATTGALTLTYVPGGRTGTAVATGASTQTGNTCDATQVTSGACGVGNVAPDEAFYFTVCPESRPVTAASCGAATTFDTVLYFRKGAATTADLACNDDGGATCTNTATCYAETARASSVAGTAVGPGLFWLIVDGYGSDCASCGNYSVALSL